MGVRLPERQRQPERPITRYEQAMQHQENLARIRLEIPKRIQRRRREKAVKKAVKEFLVCAGMGISLGLAFIYAIASDPYEPPKPEPRMVQAIGGNYYYPEDQYDQYLKERAAYIEKEEANESNLLQSGTGSEPDRD